MLEWPWKRFESFYDSFMRRSLLERLEKRKEMMVAALWANSGFEGQEGANKRKSAIDDLESHYDEAAKMIMSGQTVQEEVIDKENPFFAAGERGMAQIQAPRNDEGTVAEAVDVDDQYQGMETDQHG